MKSVLVVVAASAALLALAACESSSGDDSAAGSDASAVAQNEESNSGESGSKDESGAGAGQDADTDKSDGRAKSKSDSNGRAKNKSDADGRVARPNDNVLPVGPGQSPVLNQIPGNRAGACVDTAGLRNARSGRIAAGPFDEVGGSYGSKAPGKPADSIRLYWIPMQSKAPGLTVRVTKAEGGPSKTVTQNHVSDTDQWRYYDTNIPIDSPGTWTLRASSGDDSGCFKVTVS